MKKKFYTCKYDKAFKEIKWQKDSRSSKTIYKYLDGTDVIVNDGNTFIQIVPINSNIKIS